MTAPVKMGHKSVIRPLMGKHAEALSEQSLQVFREAYLVDIADAVGPLYTMDAGMRPLYAPMRRLVGQALTVKAPPGDNLAVHGALGEVRAGDVLVLDWRGHVAAGGCGAGSLVAPAMQGLAGVVVDGGWRDISEVQVLNLPLFGRGVSPVSPQKSQLGEVNVPVSCGGVVVGPGDVVVADSEGIVVVPISEVERVGAALEPYVAPKGIDDWPTEARQKQTAARAAFYRDMVERATTGE